MQTVPEKQPLSRIYAQAACSLTPREVEVRVLRALKTLDVIADPDRRHLYGTSTIWGRIMALYGDIVGSDDEARERVAVLEFIPTPEDIDDMLPALGCIGPETKEWVWLLRARAYGSSYEQIAEMRGKSRDFWRRRYRMVLGRLTARANGLDAEVIPE